LAVALLRVARVTAGLAESNGSLPPGLTHLTCRLTAKDRDQLRNPMLGNRVGYLYFFLPNPSAKPCGQKSFASKNPPVHNWRRGLTQVDLYNGCKMVVVVVVVVVVRLIKCYTKLPVPSIMLLLALLLECTGFYPDSRTAK